MSIITRTKDENGNLACPFCGGDVDPEGWVSQDNEGNITRGPECNVCGSTAPDISTWNHGSGRYTKPRFQFSQVVVIEEDLMGTIVKTWAPSAKRGYHYEVYVRNWNAVKEYDEADIKAYVFSKELSEDEKEWH